MSNIKKIVVIGDVHGKHQALKTIIDAIALSINLKGADVQIVGLGDYIDRDNSYGSSLLTLEYILRLNAYFNCVFLRGNHEDHVVHHGVSMDCTDCDLPVPLPQNLENFLKGMPFYLATQSFFFVHGSAPKQQNLDLIADSERAITEMIWSYSPANRKYAGRRVVVGHTVVEGVDIQSGLIMMDSGAGSEMRLSAAILNDETGECEQIYSVDVTTCSDLQVEILGGELQGENFQLARVGNE